MGRLRTDAAFRERVRAAFELGVPLSVFLGRVVGPDDPTWTPHDRQVAEAWITYRESLHTCGVPVDVGFDKNQAFVIGPDGVKVPRWTAQIDTCHACQASDAAARIHVKQGTEGDMEANNDGMVPRLSDRLTRPGYRLPDPTS